jgi:phosphate-selective porin
MTAASLFPASQQLEAPAATTDTGADVDVDADMDVVVSSNESLPEVKAMRENTKKKKEKKYNKKQQIFTGVYFSTENKSRNQIIRRKKRKKKKKEKKRERERERAVSKCP